MRSSAHAGLFCCLNLTQTKQQSSIHCVGNTRTLQPNQEDGEKMNETAITMLELKNKVAHQENRIDELNTTVNVLREKIAQERRARHVAEQENHELIEAIAVASARMYVIRRLAKESKQAIDDSLDKPPKSPLPGERI